MEIKLQKYNTTPPPWMLSIWNAQTHQQFVSKTQSKDDQWHLEANDNNFANANAFPNCEKYQNQRDIKRERRSIQQIISLFQQEPRAGANIIWQRLSWPEDNKYQIPVFAPNNAQVLINAHPLLWWAKWAQILLLFCPNSKCPLHFVILW